MDIHKLTDAELKLDAEDIISYHRAKGLPFAADVLAELLDRYTKKSAIVDEMTRLKI